jgi:hypothetical protein
MPLSRARSRDMPSRWPESCMRGARTVCITTPSTHTCARDEMRARAVIAHGWGWLRPHACWGVPVPAPVLPTAARARAVCNKLVPAWSKRLASPANRQNNLWSTYFRAQETTRLAIFLQRHTRIKTRRIKKTNTIQIRSDRQADNLILSSTSIHIDVPPVAHDRQRSAPSSRGWRLGGKDHAGADETASAAR